MKFNCAHCGRKTDKPTGHVNRQRERGIKLYCGRRCAGLERPAPRWSKDLVETLRNAWVNGASRNECAKITGTTPVAIEAKLRKMKIPRANGRPPAPTPPPPEPSISHYVHHQAVTDYRGGWNYREQCFDNNHLYREPVSLAAVW